MRQGTFDQKFLPYVLAAPQLVLVAVFVYWPAGQALAWSFTLERPFGGASHFAGLANFLALLQDDVFLRSLATTASFILCASVLSISLSLALAVAASRRLSGTNWLSSTFVWPYAVAAPLAGIIAELMLDPRLGLVAFLNDVHPGLWEPVSNRTDAFLLVVAAFVWLHVPFNFLFFLAGLNTIPQSYQDAAAVDGAGPWCRLFAIRLPLLLPYFLFVFVLDVSESATQSFGIIDVTTRGGPGGATNLLTYNIYSDGFVGLDFSLASAQSTLLIIALAAVAAVQFRCLDRHPGEP